jgi:hypothetical protein
MDGWMMDGGEKFVDTSTYVVLAPLPGVCTTIGAIYAVALVGDR